MLSPVAMLPALLTKKDRCYKRKNQGNGPYEGPLGEGHADDKSQHVPDGKFYSRTDPVIHPPQQCFKKNHSV